MAKRKRRQLKNSSAGGSRLSSDMLFIILPLIISAIICCILVFGTFQRIKKDAAMASVKDAIIQMEMEQPSQGEPSQEQIS